MGAGGAYVGSLGTLLRQARRRAGLTQEELAGKTGLSVRAIGDLERGLTVRPHRRSLELLVEALELPEPARSSLLGLSPGPRDGGPAAAPGEVLPGQVLTGQDGQQPATPSPETGSPAEQATPAAQATQSARNNGTAVPAQLPTDIPDFTGRTGQVAQLCGLLSGHPGQPGQPGLSGQPGQPQAPASPGAVRVVLVVGAGGLGKTTLAIHAAHLLARQFPDGQLFANLHAATQPVAAAEVLARFLRDLGMDAARIPADPEERAAQYRTLLADRRVLVVLDDARDAAQVQPLLPGSGSCAVVVTARVQMPDLIGARIVDLGVLPRADAHTLFAQVTGADRTVAEPSATEDVLAACAGLPLAIRIAGARLAARGSWSVRALADRLADERRRLDELRAGNLAVRASFEVSFTSLPGPAQTGGVDPARAFRLLGLWTGPSVSLPAAAALLGEDEDSAARALDVLADANLMDSPAPDRYCFHDLLRVYAADRARTQEQEPDRIAAITRVLTWYLHSTEAAAAIISPEHLRVPLPPAATPPMDFASLTGALTWCEDERPGLAAAAALAAGSGLHEIAWKLPAAAMNFYYRRSHWGDFVATHQTGLASARTLGDRQGEAWMLHNLGMAYGAQRMEESVTCFEQTLALSRENGDEMREARAANNLANTYLILDRPEQAEQAARQAIVIDQRSGDRFGEGIALDVLGCACRKLGRPHEAIGHLRQSLAIFRELDARAPGADALSELGETHLSLGQLPEAVTCLTESLNIHRDVGDQHFQAVALHRLGRAQLQAGDLGQAREMFTGALEMYEAFGETANAAEARAELASLAGAAANKAG